MHLCITYGIVFADEKNYLEETDLIPKKVKVEIPSLEESDNMDDSIAAEDSNIYGEDDQIAIDDTMIADFVRHE